ncbi:MAG: methyltransferase domain-containing protein [Pseudomonadota bacterium]
MTDAIKRMSLYQQIDRVFNELRAAGIKDGDPIPLEVLSAFDQLHYLGTQAVDSGISALSITASTRVLEVGGGIGGPARHLAQHAQCHVTALELQADLNDTAIQLTQRCGLDDRIEHRCADILDHSLGDKTFDALVSWLTFLHIPDRPKLYRQCFDAMKPGAGLFVEDYFEKNALSASERAALSSEVYCDFVPTLDAYRSDLAGAGFIHVELIDMSEVWASFVRDRYDKFKSARDRNVSIHGAPIVDALEQFYDTIVALFEAGNLGGIRFTARKPRNP